MAGKESRVASSRGRASWAVCVLVTGWVAMAGCQEAVSTQPSATRSIPDKERFLLSLVDRDFQDPEAHYQLGEYYHSEKRWDRAQYHLELAINFAPGFRKAQVALVRLFLDKGDRQAADAAVSRFSRQLSNSPQDMVDLAKAFASAGLDSYAQACFAEATKASPDSALVFKELGLYWFRKNDTAKARQYLTRSFQLDPSQPDVAGALGQLGVVVEVPRTSAEPAPQAPPSRTAAPH
jgi:tetratricopeptide (TPR) repeat protein